ncbi:unnamed protein product [Cladocopium goreaui]|uniref:DUF7869 domain-containing protein n=1 Tax=Cladocopium goreaui TaxID=2562237 RepID=A0A9P1FXA4_9DINO|nr:unnamed protein product [Cladocopium goreaui]
MLSEEEKIFMADFGMALLKECCIAARKLTDNFQETLDLMRAEVFVATFRGVIVRGSSTHIPVAVLRETEGDKRRFRDLIAAQSYTVPRLQHLASDLRLALHYIDEWETNWRCSEALASVMEHVEAILDNLRLKILGLLHALSTELSAAMSDTLSDAPSLPPDVESEDDNKDASEARSVSLPSDVQSDAEPGNLQKHCSCRLQCYLKFDEAEIEHRRAENLKDQQVRLQNLFGKVKSFVDALSVKTARIDWQMGGQKVCRPFWEYCHSVGHKQVDDMVKLAKLGHAALPEKGARMPKEKPRMDEADVWFLNLYTGLAEPTPVEDGGHRHVEELPDADQVHEVVHDVSHPLYSMSVGVGNQGALVPKRFLNQENLASLWHVYELNKSDEPRVSRDTFTKAFNRHWKRILCFKGYGQGVRCQVCADFDERRSQLTSKKERQEIDELKQQHLNRCDMDRSVNVRGNRLSKQDSNFKMENSSTSFLKVLVDGMDQAKFRCPRNLKANAAFANVQRPALHLTGAVAIGLCEVYYILAPDTKKDSNMVATCLAHLLDRCQLVVENRGPDYCLPRHLIIGADNCTRETKNAYLAQFGAFLVGRGLFDSVEFQFMVTGHTKNELDQRFSSVATILNKAGTLETPLQFANYMTHHVKPAMATEMQVEVLDATRDWQAFFEHLSMHVQGLTATHLQPDSNHVWRFVLRQQIDRAQMVENHNPNWKDFPEDPRDVVLILKQFMSSAEASQPPQLMLPAQLLGSFKRDLLTIADRRQWSEDQLEQYLKTAQAVSSDPWRLFEAQAWLEGLCHANKHRLSKEPPVFSLVLQEHEMPEIVTDLPDEALFQPDPAPRRVRVLLKRPAAAAKSCRQPKMRRPAAALPGAAVAAPADAAVAAAAKPAAAPSGSRPPMRRPAAAEPSDRANAPPESHVVADSEKIERYGCSRCRSARIGCLQCRAWVEQKSLPDGSTCSYVPTSCGCNATKPIRPEHGQNYTEYCRELRHEWVVEKDRNETFPMVNAAGELERVSTADWTTYKRIHSSHDGWKLLQGRYRWRRDWQQQWSSRCTQLVTSYEVPISLTYYFFSPVLCFCVSVLPVFPAMADDLSSTESKSDSNRKLSKRQRKLAAAATLRILEQKLQKRPVTHKGRHYDSLACLWNSKVSSEPSQPAQPGPAAANALKRPLSPDDSSREVRSRGDETGGMQSADQSAAPAEMPAHDEGIPSSTASASGSKPSAESQPTSSISPSSKAVETIEIDDECVDDASQFAKEWLAKMRTILQNYPAGPGSYLEDKMKTAADKARFATWLLETWPERPDICYHHDQVVPSVLEDELAQSPPLAIHVSSFSWTDGCGVKPAPGRDLALGLMAMYLKDGFITSGDVILMAQPLAVEKAAGLPSLWGSEESALKPFSLGYLKGRARLTSLFALLLSVFEEEVSLDDLKSFCPKLFDSVSVIWVQHMRQNSKEDEVLCNLKLSTRGSLRKAANLIQIAFMVRRLLASGGTDYTTFLRKYNQQSVAAHQLRGRKQTALKLLFESAPKDVLDEILNHVGTLGWENCAWTEENLASKRLFPGHVFPAKNRKWQQRLRVSNRSLRIMVLRIHWEQEHQSCEKRSQKKPDDRACELLAEKAACLVSLADEFCSEHPITMETVQKKILDEWSSGCKRIDMELAAQLLQKSESFAIATHMPCFKALLEESLFRAPVSSSQEVEMRDKLKRDEFDHVVKKMDYDIKVFEIWQSKVASVAMARQHAKQEHVVSEHRKIVESVEAYLDGCVRFLCWEGVNKGSDSIVPQVLSFRMEILRKLRNQNTAGAAADVPTLVLMNWTAPCLFPAGRQNDHINCLAWALHDNTNSAAIIFAPTFSYQKGKTFLEENACMQLLAQGGHNLDHQFSVLFSDRCDQRDSRPLLYPARWAFPGHVVDLGKTNAFFQSELRKAGRTDPCKQMAAKDLKEMEDMADDSLPSTTSSNHISGAAKHCQFGRPAAEEVFRKAFNQVDLEKFPAVLIVDLFPRVGDFAGAFCRLRTQLNAGTSLFYIGVGEKAKELEWLRATLLEELVEKVKLEGFQIPGAQPFQKEVNPDLLDALPAIPITNLLVVKGEGEDRSLVLPKHLMLKWRSDEDFGDEFSKCQVEEVPAECLLPCDKIAETLLFETKLGGKDTIGFQIRTNHQLYLVNQTSHELSLKAMSPLVGFGRGSFKLFKEGDTLPEKALLFHIASSDALVCLNGAAQTISEVLFNQRKIKPEATVCYHKATPSGQKTDGQTLFDFKLTHKICFVPPTKRDGADEGAEKPGKEVSAANSISNDIAVWTTGSIENAYDFDMQMAAPNR